MKYLGAALFVVIFGGLLLFVLFSVFVMPFFGVYEPMIAAVIVAILWFSTWAFLEVMDRHS